MTGRTKGAVGLAVVVAALVIAGRLLTAPDPFVPLVLEIYRTPQTRDGEVIDNLVALGPDAVPAIGSVLQAGEKFPITFVYALERIGDERGTKPIVEFISKQAPYSDGDRSTLTAEAILALRGMRNTAACKPTVSILRDETAHPRVRLASAATCARLCAGDIRAEAQSFILDAHDNQARYFAEPNKGFAPNELYSALIDVDTEESLAILLDLLVGGAPSYVAMPVIAYLSHKDRADVTDALQRVLDDSHNYELAVRLAAARALLDTGKPPTQSLRDEFDDLADEALRAGFGQETLDRARDLKARAAGL